MIADLSRFDPNGVSVANNNLFGLPYTNENAELINHSSTLGGNGEFQEWDSPCT